MHHARDAEDTRLLEAKARAELLATYYPVIVERCKLRLPDPDAYEVAHTVVDSLLRELAKGPADESLVHLWNVLEPARLAGDRSAFGGIAQLATEIQQRGEPVEQREAERLLQEVRETAEQEGQPEPVVSYPGSGNGGGYVTEGERLARAVRSKVTKRRLSHQENIQRSVARAGIVFRPSPS